MRRHHQGAAGIGKHSLDDVVGGAGVHLADRIVQDENGGRIVEGSGQGHPLLLAAGEHHPLFAHDGVQPVFKPFDGLGKACRRNGPVQLAGVRAFAQPADVLFDGAGEEPGLLGHEADKAPHVRRGKVGQGHAVHAYGSARGVVEADQKGEQGGLTASRRPDDA